MPFKMPDRIEYRNLIPVIVPFALFVLHSLLFRTWIIDDAGISFAYSRSFASGYGFVSQPGMNPVEGFSNLAWVILLTPFFALGVFDPIVTPKIAGLLLILGSFVTVQKILGGGTVKYTLFGGFFVLTFLALNPSFVIWAVSGLENSLYVLIVLLILWKTLEYGKNRNNTTNVVTTIAVLSALCALTRPDGILYAGIFPLFAFTDSLLSKNNLKDTLKSILFYLGVFILALGSYLIFRYFYFGDVVPNTYHAKGGGLSLSPDEWYEKTGNLLASVGSHKYLFISIASMFIYLSLTKNITRPLVVLSITLSISLLIYILLPSDWMPEFRFATPFFPLFYLFIYLIAELFYEKTDLNRSISSMLLIVLFTLFLTDSVSSFFSRSINFAKAPTVPFTLVAELYGHRFNEYAAALDVENGSILLPDVGGTLYYSHLKVYDLAGLTDKVIAQTLGNNPAFYDYVFETMKPTFIHTHGTWAYASNFDTDPRFRRDYIAINEAVDKSILTHTGEKIYSGDYVRKDSISNYDALLSIQASLDDQ